MKQNPVYSTVSIFLEQALNRRYNSRVGKSVFKIQDYDTDADTIVSYRNRMKILVQPESEKPGFRVSVYRIPQTRFFTTIANSASIRLEIVEFMDTTLILISCFDDKPVKFVFPASVQIPDQKRVDNVENSVVLTLKGETAVLWDGAEPAGPEALAGHLQECYKRERANHLLRHITTSNRLLLEKIDRLWSRVDGLSAGGQPESELRDSQESLSFWRDEICAYLGREKTEIASLQSDAIVSEPGSFLYMYLHWAELETTDILLPLQDFWKKISLPSGYRVLSEMIRENADELIAYSLLVLHFRFWWHHLLYRRIMSSLESHKEMMLWDIWHLLWLLNSNVSVLLSDSRTILTARGSESEYALKTERYSLLRQYSSRQVRIFLRLRDVIEVKVDKDVITIYETDKNRLTFEPFTWNYPGGRPSFVYTVFSYNDCEIRIPLAWRQFSVEIDGSRFRFLKKQKRFQISARMGVEKIPVPKDCYVINETTGRYRTFYRNIETRKAETFISLYNTYGSRITGFGPHVSEIFVKGFGTDSHGLLTESYNLKKNGSGKSRKIFVNNDETTPLSFTGSTRVLKLQSAKGRETEIRLEQSSGLFHRFLGTAPEQLEHECIILHKNSEAAELRAIREDVFDLFRFYPKIRVYEPGKMEGGRFYFVIDEQVPVNVVLKRLLFRVCRTGTGAGIIYFHIHPEDCLSFFKNFQALFLAEL